MISTIKCFEIHQTDDYQGLAELFLKNNLELSGIAPENGIFVRCYEAVHIDTEERIGGIRLENRGGEFIITGIAVDEKYRKFGIGRELVGKILEVIKGFGGKKAYALTKSPLFFESIGFVYENADIFNGVLSCDGCEQLNKTCFPRSMCMHI